MFEKYMICENEFHNVSEQDNPVRGLENFRANVTARDTREHWQRPSVNSSQASEGAPAHQHWE